MHQHGRRRRVRSVQHRVLALRFALAVLAIALLAVVSSGCTDDPSAPYFLAGREAAPTPSIDSTSGSQSAPNVIDARFIHGGVDRPDPNLTPGLVASTDLVAICQMGKRIHGEFLLRDPLIAPSVQQEALAEYNIPAARAPHYGLDFLVPLQLGGANAIQNIWPVSTTHGVGFREKEILNIRLHVLVCERQMPLDQAQKAVATDWVKLWLKVG